MKTSNRARDFHSSNLFKEKSPVRRHFEVAGPNRQVDYNADPYGHQPQVQPNNPARSSYTQIFNSDDSHWKRNSNGKHDETLL